MDAWHRSWKVDIGLRLFGLMLCGIAYLAIHRLFAFSFDAHKPGIIAFALATGGFVSASAGSAMLCLGKHWFDEIEVGAR